MKKTDLAKRIDQLYKAMKLEGIPDIICVSSEGDKSWKVKETYCSKSPTGKPIPGTYKEKAYVIDDISKVKDLKANGVILIDDIPGGSFFSIKDDSILKALYSCMTTEELEELTKEELEESQVNEILNKAAQKYEKATAGIDAISGLVGALKPFQILTLCEDPLTPEEIQRIAQRGKQGLSEARRSTLKIS